MPPTRVIYDGLQKGTHTWCYEEGAGEAAVCPEHGRIKTAKAMADGTPRTDLPTVCPALSCAKKLKREACIVVIDRPDVFPNQVLEVADLNSPTSERAYIVRDHIARGVARVIADGEEMQAEPGVELPPSLPLPT